MDHIVTFFRRYPVVALTVLVAAIAAAFSQAGNSSAPQIIITVFVGIFALWTAVGMIRDIIAGHFGLDILALVAMLATLAVGEYWASLIIVLMLSGGEALEDFAANRAKGELTSLLNNSPTEAHRLVQSGEDEVEDIPVDEVKVGDLLLVRPSELVPVDCILESPSGTFDEASLTGESLPVSKKQGDEVPSGAVNGSTAIRLKALRQSSDSQYQQIIQLVKESADSKAPIVRLADKFAVPFTLVSLIIAGIAWAVSGNPVRFAEVLVLATPCPLLIAAPVAFMGGMSRAAKAGIVVKGGAVLEETSRTSSVAFDKTGTLTHGDAEVSMIVPTSATTATELLQLTASAEQYSSHILAEGIRRCAEAENISLLTADSAEEVTANGVIAQIQGRQIAVGKLSYIQSLSPEAHAADLKAGQVAVYTAAGSEFLGAIILSDAIRPESAAVIHWLKENQISNLAMVTGDSEQTAEAVATQIGITNVNASLTPVDKVNIVRNLDPKPTLMVGDGVNDAPVLAAANIGVALGAKGSTSAGEAADAVILRDSITQIPDLIAISRQTVRVAITAIWIGIIASVMLMLVATTGIIPAVIGALLQEVLDLIAILYALRALTGKLPNLHIQEMVGTQQLRTDHPRTITPSQQLL